MGGAAVSQATELGSLLRVGFDLYRHEILRQLDIEVPVDSAGERALRARLTAELLGIPQARDADPAPPAGVAGPPAADAEPAPPATAPADGTPFEQLVAESQA